MEVQLEEFFPSSDLHGMSEIERSKSINFKNIEKTYLKYCSKFGSYDIVIITNLVEPQIYKFGPYEVKIKNSYN